LINDGCRCCNRHGYQLHCINPIFSKTEYIKELPTREILQPTRVSIPDDQDIFVTGLDGEDYGLPDSPPRERERSFERSRPALPEDVDATIPQRTILTKKPAILQREPKEDVEMANTLGQNCTSECKLRGVAKSEHR
jgi:hypothetical protein